MACGRSTAGGGVEAGVSGWVASSAVGVAAVFAAGEAAHPACGPVDGTRDDACFPLKLPRAWERSGWYPTEYCLRHRENRDELITSLEGFVYRHAS
jgi:hypothetical protein